jgi:serine/threonine-protein kinase SRPK3
VHLARDTETNRAVAIKVIKSASAYADAAANEVDVLDHLADRAHASTHEGARYVAELLDDFQHPGRFFDHSHQCA